MFQPLPFRFHHLLSAGLLLAAIGLPGIAAAQAPRWHGLVEVQPMVYHYPFVAQSVVATLDGDAIVAGNYPERGPNPPVPVVDYYAPLTRVAPDGQIRWTLLTPSFTDSTWGYIIDPKLVAVTRAGHVAVSGAFWNGPAILGTDTLADDPSAPYGTYFIGEIDGQTGQWRWARTLDATPTKLAPDPSTGGFLVGVGVDASNNLDGTVPDTTATFGVLRVQNAQWQWLGGFRGAGQMAQLSGTPQGDVVVSGTVPPPTFDPVGTVQFGGLTLHRSSRARNTYLARLSAGGSWQWARLIDGSSADVWGGVPIASELLATDAAGNVFLAGSFIDTLNVGSFTLRSVGAQAGFLAQLDAVGIVQSAEMLAIDTVGGYHTSTSIAYVEIKGLQVDAQGSVILGGHFGGRLHLGSQLLNSTVHQVPWQGYELPADILVARRTSAGWSWVTTISGSTDKWMNALHLSPAAQVVVAAMGQAGPLALGQDTTHLTQFGTFVTWLGERPLTGLAHTTTTNNNLVLWPNPAHGFAHLTVPDHATEIVLLDALGREVRRQPIAPTQHEVVLNLRDLPAGFYLVRAGNRTARLVVRGDGN